MHACNRLPCLYPLRPHPTPRAAADAPRLPRFPPTLTPAPRCCSHPTQTRGKRRDASSSGVRTRQQVAAGGSGEQWSYVPLAAKMAAVLAELMVDAPWEGGGWGLKSRVWGLGLKSRVYGSGIVEVPGCGRAHDGRGMGGGWVGHAPGLEV